MWQVCAARTTGGASQAVAAATVAPTAWETVQLQHNPLAHAATLCWWSAELDSPHHLLLVQRFYIQPHSIHAGHIRQLTPALPLGRFHHVPAPRLCLLAWPSCCLLVQCIE